MTRADLKDGMIIEERDGGRYVLSDGILYDENKGWSCVFAYNEDLTSYNEENDIVKVYDARGLLLWDRENQEVVINEEEILTDLVNAWNKFGKLESQHPNELEDFADGIHKCQYVLAMRFARESRPDLFPKKQ